MARGVDKDGVAGDSIRIAAGDAEGSTYKGKFVPDVGVPGIPWRCAGLASLSFLGFLALPLVGCRNEGVTGKKVLRGNYDSNSIKADYKERGKRKSID